MNELTDANGKSTDGRRRGAGGGAPPTSSNRGGADGSTAAAGRGMRTPATRWRGNGRADGHKRHVHRRTAEGGGRGGAADKRKHCTQLSKTSFALYLCSTDF